MMIKIIFIGTSQFGRPALESLIKNGYQILKVVTQPDKTSGRKKELIPSPIKSFALENNLEILQPKKISEIKEEISNLNSDLIIVASYGQIISEEILNYPSFKSINLHPSLLPKYRGPSPIQTAILNGDKNTGTTIMLMDAKMDHGPILIQKKIKIEDNDNYQSLEKKLSRLSAKTLIEILPQYLKKEIEPKIQDEDQATYTKMFSRQDGKINLNDNPKEIEKKIRAFYPWPGVWTIIEGKRIKILEVKIVNNSLILKKVQPEGKKSMDWKSFKYGIKI